MKYYCETCDGSGTIEDHDGVFIECSICDGARIKEICISMIKIGADVRHRDELLTLQKDARRVISDCGKMLVCNPPHWKSYVAQLEKTIETIETQAIKLLP